jgi:hypothetical protein
VKPSLRPGSGVRSRSVAVVRAVSFVLAFVLAIPGARAQGKVEAAARALQKKAMEDDYLASDFVKAQEKLEKAIVQCGTDKCPALVRSRLRRDLGTVQIGGAIDREKGVNNFVEALKIDPGVLLDPDTRTKDLDAAFAEAKKRLAGGTGAASGAPPPAAAPSGQPQGDFQHTPVPEQQVRVPVPVYVEYVGEDPLVRVIARYKGFGMTDWKPVELKKMGEKGWGGLLPCADVQQGATLYYVQGFNANNDPVATGGDRNNPYRVAIKPEKVAEPPHLPNAPPPAQCADTGDCPPNFPGCKKAPVGAAPVEGKTESGKEAGEYCEEDGECRSDQCESSKCAEKDGDQKRRRLWVGVSGSLDYTFVPSSDDVCKLKGDLYPVNEQNYYCVRSDGTDYPSRDVVAGKGENDSIVLTGNRGSDNVTGGGAFGNFRVLLTLDYALSGNLFIGGRVGLVLNRYPGQGAELDGNRFAVPIHAEVRATYVLGKDAIFKKGLAPYFFGGVGIGQFETKVSVQAIESRPGVATVGRDVDAWHIAGPAFVALGGGGRLTLASRFALVFGVRGTAAFLDAFAPSIGPEVGGQVGF